jgi:hypothetical protein
MPKTTAFVCHGVRFALIREREREREGETSISVVNLEQMRSNEKVHVVPVDTGSPTQACPIARNRARLVALFLRSCLYFAYAILCENGIGIGWQILRNFIASRRIFA